MTVEFDSTLEIQQFTEYFLNKIFPAPSIPSQTLPQKSQDPPIPITSMIPIHKGKRGGSQPNAGRKPKIRIADPHSPTPIICKQCGEKVIGEYIIKKHEILCKSCQTKNLPYPDPYLYPHPVPQTG